ncbi:hypothetical protein QEN19_002940 [Hanseniaspora menglaensis]
MSVSPNSPSVGTIQQENDFLEQPFLQYIKQELVNTLKNKDILVYELVKQLENNNITDFLIFKDLDSEDLDDILNSLVSINEDKNLKNFLLITLKLLVNKVKNEYIKKDDDNLVIDNQIFDLFLQIDNKLDHTVVQFNDFKQKLFAEISINKGNDQPEPQSTAASPKLTPAASMTTLTPQYIKSSQASSSNQQSQMQEPSGEEPFKQLKASKQDSSQKILMNAMIKHNIPLSKLNDYVLIISYQDKEIIMTEQDKPVEIFKNLKKRGYQPAIMLREIDKINAALEESNNVTPGGRL